MTESKTPSNETDKQNAIATMASQAWMSVSDATALYLVMEAFKQRAKLKAEASIP